MSDSRGIVDIITPKKVFKMNPTRSLKPTYEELEERVRELEKAAHDHKKTLKAFQTFKAVTDRKQSEKALMESEEKWRNILVNTPQIGVALDSEARIIFANDHLLNLTGWKRHEVMGRDWFNLFIPEAIRETVREFFHRVMSQKDTSGLSNYENEILTRKKEILNVAWSNVITRDKEGNILDVTCLGIDLTERKHAEEKYRFMMESFVDPLYICSPDFRIEYMNPAMIRRLGKNGTGENCYRVLHGMGDKCGWCVFETVATGKTVEVNIKSPLDDRNYRVTHMPIHHKDGSISQMALLRDITDYLKAVAEKEKVQSQLIQSQKMESIGTLAGGIAHEFNNILSIIMGNTELALDELQEWNPAGANLAEIKTASLRARDVVKQLLTFSRKDDTKKTALDMGAVVKESLKLIRSSIPTNIDICRNIAEELNPIMGNSTQINQVLINLCTNAADAMLNTGGSIGIDLDKLFLDENKENLYPGLSSGPYVKLVISDTGCGMDMDTLNRVFEPYFTTKEIGKGTGIGLAVVHGIVERHNGLIHVDSVLGKGTVFTLLFPAFQGRIEPAGEEPNNLPKGNERILFVDDEPILVKLGKKRLEIQGYTVQGATDPLSALSMFKADPAAFDLLITDMAMPGMTGDQLLSEILGIRPRMPAMLCTGYSETISEKKAYEIGFFSFVMKPVDKTELAVAVRKILDGLKN